MRKIIQMIAASYPSAEFENVQRPVLIALCDDGTVWHNFWEDDGYGGWYSMKYITNDSENNPFEIPLG